MDQIGPLLTAVLAANMLSAMFIYGMVRASKIAAAGDLDGLTAMCIVIPLLFMVGGVYVFAYG